ncbi:glycine betaine transporter [Bhargavaea ginsengi]|uniref:Glycine betaine transporter n=1 Tax=Bhargavaea ginsengi TaxID=426757 RepID=A0A1H6VC78_9BACL|nr:BCCT family transporter [Bhargavaea ginsengi]MCM3088335.1 BCCT family transporter [Bhargavaea ginsengi]SEI97882.1 glycine betaine transporter [Bhargavaea ginsengi]
MKKVTKVFYITLALIAMAVLFGVVMPEQYETATGNIQAFILTNFGWYYLLLMAALVLVSLFFALSPYGRIRLGKDTDRPDFSTPTWLAMLFSAGMGIGLVFYGAAEPLTHFAVNPPTEEPGTEAALKDSLVSTYLHWGILPWAMYGLTALALAFFQFRKNEPGLISATMKPIFGDKMNGPWGIAVDVLAVFATAFGVASSLGFGAVQINGGLNHLFGVEVGFPAQFAIISVVTVLFMISAWSGLSKGIKYLSNTNMVLAVLLLIFVVIVGPTLMILNLFTETLGTHFQNLIQLSFRSAPLSGDNRDFVEGWTIFYWAWWISWSPFVGMFIARVSRGRTIREFLLAIIFVPTLFSIFWFASFGTTAASVHNSGTDLSGLATELVLFNVFDQLPMSIILSLIAILLISSFFITSADSATFVLGIQSTNGSLTPPNQVKLMWGVAQSGIAALLLYVGGLQAIQNTIIIAALPFSVILILMVYSTYKALKQERRRMEDLAKGKQIRNK